MVVIIDAVAKTVSCAKPHQLTFTKRSQELPLTSTSQSRPVTAGPLTLTGTEPFFMVLNTGSGKRDSNAIEETIKSVLNQTNRDYQLFKVDRGADLQGAAEHATQMARENDGIVVAVGGDGTLNAVCQSVVGQGVPFGILPQGTFNYFGRAHGISQNTEQAIEALLNARIEPISVGELNGHYFLVNASLGLYPRLLEDREVFKQRYGRSRLVALWSAVVTLAKAHRQLQVVLEHGGQAQQLRTPTLVVFNNALQLEHVGLQPQVAPHIDHLIATTARPVGTLALYGLLVRGLLSRMGDAENVNSFGFETLTVRTDRPSKRVKVAMDGEIFHMHTPLTFRLAAHALPLLIPRSAPPPEHP